MATTKNKTATATDGQLTPSSAAYEAARVRREQSEAAVDAAEVASRNSRKYLADLKDRVSAGDASVTSLELLTAESDVPRLDTLASASEAMLNDARHTEAKALAAYLADSLTDEAGEAAAGLARADIDAAEAQVFTALARALVPLAAVALDQQNRYDDLLGKARAAKVGSMSANRFGLHPSHPSYVEVAPVMLWQGGRDRPSGLLLNGEVVTRRGARDVLAEALARVADAALSQAADKTLA